MAQITDEALKIVGRLVETAVAGGVRIERAYLFGSFARGTPREWSDIDVALVSPDFTGTAFYDRKRLIPFLLIVDTRLEIHPFRTVDFTDDNGFAAEIMKHGVELKLAG